MMENIANAFNGLIEVIKDQKCNKHAKPIHYVKELKTGEVFCPVCQLAKETDSQLEEMQKNMITRAHRDFLQENSLIDRASTFGYRFDNFEYKLGSLEEQAYKQARQIAGFYYKNPKKTGNSLLFGKAGSGKTHLAMAVLNAVNESSSDPMQRCLFLNVTALFKEMRAYIADKVTNKWSEDYAIEKVSKADLIVIDDLGAESADGNATKFVQDILWEIYEANQRIITTTNLTMDELQATYHDRLVSRFLEGSRGKLIDFTKINDKRMWK